MNARLLLLAAMAVLPLSAAHAQTSDQGSVAVSGSVGGLCVLGQPSETAVELGQLIASSGTRTGRIAALPGKQITLPGSFCNFAGTVLTVSAQALVASDTSEVQPGFARAVNYTSQVDNWATTAASVTTEASASGTTPAAEAAGGVQPTPKIADLALRLSNFTVPSDQLLVAGGYSGLVTITLGPAVTGSN